MNLWDLPSYTFHFSRRYGKELERLWMRNDLNVDENITSISEKLDTLAFSARLETIGLSGLSDNSVDSLRGLVWS